MFDSKATITQKSETFPSLPSREEIRNVGIFFLQAQSQSPFLGCCVTIDMGSDSVHDLVYYLELSYQVYLAVSRSRTEAKRASPSLLIAPCPSLLKAEQFDNSLQSLQNLVPRQLCWKYLLTYSRYQS